MKTYRKILLTIFIVGTAKTACAQIKPAVAGKTVAMDFTFKQDPGSKIISIDVEGRGTKIFIYQKKPMIEAEFLALVHENQGIIHKICRLYRDTHEDREDLFQEIVFQLWRSLKNFENRSKFTTWMYRIALNTAITAYRKKNLLVEYPGVLPDITEDPREENLKIRQEQLFGALKQLNDADKALITLYLEDLSYNDIAEITGLSANNVGVKLNRIKTKLQTLLKLR